MRILVIDDSRMSLNLISMFLKSADYQVETAESGKEALEILDMKDDIVLTITDIMMPDMNGIELLEEIKSQPQYRHIPVIMLTALTDKETVRKAALLGCEHYIAKPVSKSVLLEKVESIIGKNKSVLWSKYKIMGKLGLKPNEYKEMMIFFSKTVNSAIEQLNDYLRGENDTLDMSIILTLYENARLTGAERALFILKVYITLKGERTLESETKVLKNLLKELWRLNEELSKESLN